VLVLGRTRKRLLLVIVRERAPTAAAARGQTREPRAAPRYKRACRQWNLRPDAVYEGGRRQRISLKSFCNPPPAGQQKQPRGADRDGSARSCSDSQKIVVHPRNESECCACRNSLEVYPQGGIRQHLQRGRCRHPAWTRAYDARPSSRSMASKADAIV
jgi:hypothetical protein